MRIAMYWGGAVFALFNTLPMPWWLRRWWMRFLYWMTCKGILLFPSLLRFVESQNTAFQMGKQAGEGYESLVQLEEVLKAIESAGVPADRLREAVALAEAEGIPPERWGPYLARSVFEPADAERVLTAAFQATRY